MAQKKKYLVTLPQANIEVAEYHTLSGIGGTYATTPQGAVGNYLHRSMPRNKASIVQRILRERYGGSEHYAMELPEDYEDTNKNILTGIDKEMAQELEICHILEKKYGSQFNPRNPQRYLSTAHRVIEELERIGKKQNA